MAIDDTALYSRGWIEKRFDTEIVIDGARTETPTHQVDCFKNRVALEIEWNNKDPFFDRDLNIFRLLFERCSPGPHLELFARGTQPGWTAWGEQSTAYYPSWETYANHSQRERAAARDDELSLF